MTLLDAYALVAFLGDEHAAGEVEESLRRGDCRMSVVNLAEAVDVTARVHGLALSDIRQVIEMLVGTGDLALVAPTAEIAWRAASLRQTHYRSGTCELSLADCFLLACAAAGDEIATADPAVAAVARLEGLAVAALRDSAGRRP